MSAGTDFLASLQKKTVKSTVQQKQQKRANASAVDVSALLEAALRQKKPTEAVADVRQSADVATASFLPPTDTHQGKSTQQKPKSASDKAVPQKQSTSKSKDIVDAGITALIQKALDAKKVMEQPDIAERLQSSMESEFTQLFAAENEPQESKFVSTATFRTTKKKIGSIRVAAYIRVSTDMSDQENSYETQEKYFNQLIQGNPEWNAVGVYSDYGISGTSKEKRTGFRRLMRHCKDGKIDRIVCKSISRFARNTADFMTALDTLHDCGVTILFEKENLDTADPTSDFILTTLAAIAQEESRSISGNIRQGNKMRFPKGEVPNKIMYGYRYNGKMVTSESGYEYKDIEVVEEEAKVVRRIFNEVVEGKAYTEIARGLNLDKIPAPESDMARARKRNSKKGQLNSDLQDGWTGGNITRIVRAERYMGAVLIQKVFTPDYLTHTVQKNNGEVPQYFVRNHHPAIIDEDLFQKAQEVVKANSELYNRTRFKKKPRAFSQRLICEECGRFYSVTNGNGSNPIWRCPTSSQTTGKCICHAEKVYEEQIVRVFRKAILERFRLTIKPIHDNVAVADIMSGRFKEQYDNFTPEADSFVSQMLARLESIQKLDFMERDRAFYKKQIAAAHTSVESTNKKIRLLKSQVDVMHTRLEVLGDEMISPASIEEKKKLIEKLEQDVQKDTDTEQKLTEQLDYMENYWEELESDYERREKAIEWMKNLPVGRDGTVAFLNEVTEEHCKAFILSITIYSPLKFTVHWFDDTKTEVQMDSNIEDYHNTASYYDGHTMRDGSQRKKYVRRTRRK